MKNVYGDLGQLFAWTTTANPRLGAAVMGTLVKGLGADHVVWGTDAVWTGSPQWQIEALRRLEIPEDMQKKYGYKPLGPADGPVKTAIFGGNNARLYRVTPQQQADVLTDRIAQVEGDLREARRGPQQSALRLYREAHRLTRDRAGENGGRPAAVFPYPAPRASG